MENKMKTKVDIVKIINLKGDFAGEMVEMFHINDIDKAITIADNLNSDNDGYYNGQLYDIIIHNTKDISPEDYKRLENKDYYYNKKHGLLNKPERNFKYTARV